MDTDEKLVILVDAAKYDASCASSGTRKRNSVNGRGLGSTEGSGIRVQHDRRRVLEAGGRRVLVTVHPSYLPRLDNARRRQAEYAHFVADLSLALRWLENTSERATMDAPPG